MRITITNENNDTIFAGEASVKLHDSLCSEGDTIHNGIYHPEEFKWDGEKWVTLNAVKPKSINDITDRQLIIMLARELSDFLGHRFLGPKD